MSTIVVPTVGEVTDPAPLQQAKDDIESLEADVLKLETARRVTTTRTSNVGTFTAETQVDSATAALTSGRRYRVVWHGHMQSSVADGYTRCRIREDTSAGTQIQLSQMPTTIAASQAAPLMMEAEYTAASTGNKTFVVTVVRQAGTGNITATASADAPTYMYVEYVSG